MKITHEDSGLMILKEGNAIAYVVGAVFLVLGIIGFVRPDIFSEAPNQLVSVIGVLAGIFIFLIVKRETIFFDKSVSQMRVVRASALSKNEKTFDLRIVTTIACREVARRGSNGTTSKETKLAFLFKDGTEFVASGGIRPRFSGGSFLRNLISSPGMPEVAARVSKFLGIPVIDQRNPSVKEVLSTISDAVSKTVSDAIANRDKKSENGS